MVIQGKILQLFKKIEIKDFCFKIFLENIVHPESFLLSNSLEERDHGVCHSFVLIKVGHWKRPVKKTATEMMESTFFANSGQKSFQKGY